MNKKEVLRRARKVLLSAQKFWVESGGGLYGPVDWADLTRPVQDRVRRVMNGMVPRIRRGIILRYDRAGRLVGVRVI